ncbi:helix-turn-helix domain-containing protein [Flagellimonas sp.]|uniref:AraC family transcriptional regulator n=1 Tax=Flagellimonas sp. TaxID=2058762 RepID=UPI003AB2479A
MVTTVRSTIFRDSAYVKKYSKDFFTEELIENHIHVATPQVTGIIKELQLNGIFVIAKNMNAPQGYSFEVSNNFPVFVLHFEIAGNYRYTPHGQQDSLIQIPEFHWNMFYLPITNGRLDYKGAPRRTLEIVFTLGLIKKIAGENFKNILEKVDVAVQKNAPFLFWEHPQAISPEIAQVLEEIIACPHTGHLKKTYLQSKITTLLVDLLMEGNGKPKSSFHTTLPKSDSDILRIIAQYIKTNLDKKLSIAELALMAGFNESKLKRDFKLIYGSTIFKYITRLRMEKAGYLIRTKGLSIAQAAHEVGYSNPQHFTNAFKRTLGYLPSKLKKTTGPID